MPPSEGFLLVLHLLRLQNHLQKISEWKLLLMLLTSLYRWCESLPCAPEVMVFNSVFIL